MVEGAVAPLVPSFFRPWARQEESECFYLREHGK